MKIKEIYLTDPGLKKSENEDFLLIDNENNFYIVADGMGGAERGTFASQQTCHLLHAKFKQKLSELSAHSQDQGYSGKEEIKKIWDEIINLTSNELLSKAKESEKYKGLASTMTLVWLFSGKAYIAHVGDCRAYLCRNNSIYQLTQDHTFGAQAKLKGNTEKIARASALTQAIGFSKHIVIEHLFVEVESGDRIFLSTDGLTDLVDDFDLAKSLNSALSPQTLVELFSLAKAKGARDNMTSIVLDITTERQIDVTSTIKYQYLQMLPFFQKLKYADIARLMEIADAREFKTGETVIKLGEQGREFFVILRGIVSVQREGKELTALKAGDYFGEMALIDGNPRSADIIATTEVSVLEISHSNFFKLVQRSPQLGVRVLWNFNKRFAGLMRLKASAAKSNSDSDQYDDDFNFVDV